MNRYIVWPLQNSSSVCWLGDTSSPRLHDLLGQGPQTLPGAGLLLTAGALPRHRRVWGDPCHLCQWRLHQPDRELPLRVPHGLQLQQGAAGLRRCRPPASPAPGGMLVPPPSLCSLGKSFKPREPQFPPLRMGLTPFRGAPSHITPLNVVLAASGGTTCPEVGGGLGLGFDSAGKSLFQPHPAGCTPQTWTSVPAGRAPASRMPTASTSPAATAASAPEGTSCRQGGFAWVSGDPSREVRELGVGQSQTLPPSVTWVGHGSVRALFLGCTFFWGGSCATWLAGS